MPVLPRLILVFWLVFACLVGPAQAKSPAPSGMTVRFYPAGPLQVGDEVSIEVLSPPGEDFGHKRLEVFRLSGANSIELGSAPFDRAAFDQYRAVLTWAWDTRGTSSGEHTLLFRILPDQVSWEQDVTVTPAEPGYGQRYHWSSVEIGCCVVHYITSTPAERDLARLLDLVETQARAAIHTFDHVPAEKMVINLLPRVLGQGGFAGEELLISYTDKNYTNTDLALVVHHEMVHRIDDETNTGARPTLFVEGLAVYLTGGHYKSEPLLARAAVLYKTGQALPLQILAENFYDHQHEIGYTQAGALVEYMVRTWGWDHFISFYRGIQPDPSGSHPRAIDTALKTAFGLSLANLDDRFQTMLLSLPVVPDLLEDMRLTIELYDAIRAYQLTYDPSAHFQQVWLPDAAQMRQRGIVGDYLRGPLEKINSESETLLSRAGEYWRLGRFDQAWAELAGLR